MFWDWSIFEIVYIEEFGIWCRLKELKYGVRHKQLEDCVILTVIRMCQIEEGSQIEAVRGRFKIQVFLRCWRVKHVAPHKNQQRLLTFEHYYAQI